MSCQHTPSDRCGTVRWISVCGLRPACRQCVFDVIVQLHLSLIDQLGQSSPRENHRLPWVGYGRAGDMCHGVGGGVWGMTWRPRVFMILFGFQCCLLPVLGKDRTHICFSMYLWFEGSLLQCRFLIQFLFKLDGNPLWSLLPPPVHIPYSIPIQNGWKSSVEHPSSPRTYYLFNSYSKLMNIPHRGSKSYIFLYFCSKRA